MFLRSFNEFGHQDAMQWFKQVIHTKLNGNNNYFTPPIKRFINEQIFMNRIDILLILFLWQKLFVVEQQLTV